ERRITPVQREQAASATSPPPPPTSTAEAIARAAKPLRGGGNDYDPLLARAETAEFVLLGEATHGTHEFYTERERITRRLIAEQGFNAVAVEADWPDAYRINRFVR